MLNYIKNSYKAWSERFSKGGTRGLVCQNLFYCHVKWLCFVIRGTRWLNKNTGTFKYFGVQVYINEQSRRAAFQNHHFCKLRISINRPVDIPRIIHGILRPNHNPFVFIDGVVDLTRKVKKTISF